MVGNKRVRQIVQIALYLCLIIVSSYIRIPIMVVPITLQLVCIYVLSSISEDFNTSKALMIYLVGGLVGLPLFTQGGGITYFIKPHFGYLLGFLGMSLFIETLRHFLAKRQFGSRLGMLIGSYILFYMIALGYVYGLHHLFLSQPLSIALLVQMYWLPFIVSDSVTLFLGQQLVAMMWSREKKVAAKEIVIERM